MNMKKRLLNSMSICLVFMVALVMIISAKSANAEQINIDISEGSLVINHSTYTLGSESFSYESGAEFVITGTTTENTITVAKNVSANITLNEVSIIRSNTNGEADAFVVAENSTGNITINIPEGTKSTLSAAYSHAIKQENDGTGSNYGTLTVVCDGTLVLSSAPLGGAISATKLVIDGTGNIDADAGTSGPSIVSSSIVINGGSINSQSIHGNALSADNITINDGNISCIATLEGSNAILATNTLKINGGSVSATANLFGGALRGGNVIINNGNVVAISGSMYAGIQAETIDINGGIIYAEGGANGAGIGGGNDNLTPDISISGAIVTAIAGDNANAIGGGFNTSNSALNTTDSIVIDISSIYIVGEMGTTPKNSSGNSVACKVISNPDDLPILIDDKMIPFTGHISGPSVDGLDVNSVYLWIPSDSITSFGSDVSDKILIDLSYGSLVIDENTYKYGDYEYSYVNGTEFVLSGDTEQYHVTVVKDVDANITLNGLVINYHNGTSSDTFDHSAILIEDGSKGNVRILIADDTENKLAASGNHAGIQKNGDASDVGSLTFKAEENESGNLLVVAGDKSAAIGGGYDNTLQGSSTRNIIFDGGNIKAVHSGSTGAAIGSGYNGNASYITFNGGTIWACAYKDSAAIGSSGTGNTSYIYFHGGSIEALGGSNAGSIGSNAGNTNNLYFDGGKLVANHNGNYGPGIGAQSGKVGNLFFYDGAIVEANGTTNAAGIGTAGAPSAQSSNNQPGAVDGIYIYGGTITAKSGKNLSSSNYEHKINDIGAGIYCPTYLTEPIDGSSSNIVITGGSVNAEKIGEPTDGENAVELLVIENTDNEIVWINNTLWKPKNHNALNSEDYNLYAWVPEGTTLENVKYGIQVPVYTAPKSVIVEYTGELVPIVKQGTTNAGTFMYKVGEDGTWSSELPTASEIDTYTVYWKIDGGEYCEDVTGGSFVSKIIKASQEAPTGLVAHDESASDKNDGWIEGLTTKMQYSIDGGVTWNNVTNTDVLFAPGEVYVRYAATSTHNASNATVVVINPYSSSVSESTSIFCKASYQAYLIEPWAMRVTVRFTDANGTTIDVAEMQDYGAYAIRAGELDDLTDVTIGDIINNAAATKVTKSSVEGTGMWATGDGKATFGFDDGLFTYRMSEEVYWVAYCVDANGNTHYMAYKTKSLHAIAETLVASTTTNSYIKAILEDMLYMEEAIIDYRSDFDNLTDLEPSNPSTVENCGINFGLAASDGKYSIGNSYRVSLIEPWSIRLVARIYDTTDEDTSSTDHIDYSTADDYGVIVFQDIDGTHGDMSNYADLLAINDAYVYSKSQGNMGIDPNESTKVSAGYDKDIFTYQLDKNIYCVSFVEIDGQFYYSKLLTRNIHTYMSDSIANNSGTEKLLKVYDAMIEMYESVKAYHESL